MRLIMSRKITCTEILQEIHKKTPELGNKILIVFDLDDTVFNTFYRRYHVYNRFLKSQFNLPELSQHLHKSHYNFKSTLEKSIEFRKNDAVIMNRYTQLFLSDSLLSLDRPFPGFNSFIQKLQALDLHIIFLTARPERTMKKGTLRVLKKYQLLNQISPKNSLIMKKNESLSDLQFKIIKLKSIKNQFPSFKMLIFDNESQNCKAFEKILPKSSKIIRFNSVQKNNTPFNGYVLDSWHS